MGINGGTGIVGSGSVLGGSGISVPKGGVAPFVGLLDTYPNAAAAYSVRRLSSTYTGALMEVRRSSDNTTQNIGYDANGDLDTTALLAFVGAGDGFVRTWYDQSGNTNNATQTTASAQPKIITSGAFTLENGKPLISHIDGATQLNTPTAGSATSWRFGVVSAPVGVISTLYSENPNDYVCIAHNGSGSTFVNSATLNNIYVNGLSIIATRDSFYDNLLSSGVLTLDIDDSLFSTINFGYTPATSVGMLNMQEMIFYSSNQSGNKSGIETNINTYYSIYSPPSGIGTWAIGTTFVIQ